MAYIRPSEEPCPTIKEACRLDDVQLLSRTLLAQGITTTNVNDESSSWLLHYACEQCFCYNALMALTYILSDLGFSTDNISCHDIPRAKDVSTQILDVLLAHGWNINKRVNRAGRPSGPFLWAVLENEDLVRYCLEHGASVHPEGQSPLQPDIITKDQLRCPPILETAAAKATVATFDLLRAYGAPLGWRSLHNAVHAATFPWMSGRPGGTPTPGTYEEQYPKAQTYAERMAMVHHLVKDLGLDVNGPDQPPTQIRLPMRRGPPLCYVSDSDVIEYGAGPETWEVLDTRELTWYLLDHGADPRPALDRLQGGSHPTFIADVEAWRARKEERSSKCCCQ
jgi:hypothetical protein